MYAGFEKALEAAVASGRIAGAVAAVADRDGVTYTRQAGVRQAGEPAAMTQDTIFWLASMTKAVVSVAALREVEAGRLGLDGDLSGLLPEFADLKVLEGFGEDGAPRLRPARRAPTLRDLLTHTSGFGYGFLSEDLTRWHAATGAADPNGGTRVAHVLPLLHEPGEAWSYGIGIDWAGLAVEAASGQRLDAYLSEHILGPLGMTDTGFAPVDPTRRAVAHLRVEGTLFPAPTPPGGTDAEVLSGGGGLHGTAPDYIRFLRMLLNGGELDGARVLKPETVRSLSEVQTGPLKAGAFKTANGVLTTDFDLYPDMLTGHGLATVVTPEATKEGRSPGALNWAGIFNTYFWADPEAGKAGVLLTQLMPFGDPDVLALLRALEKGA
ncbi:serine hydrolase domain-containing protein [Phenylobacterium parvum]|uniref:serine hydrolase domain-containing protein n=1 Tax=Phenylobacterium parvum TaxID=2201350 RepID=UPI0013A53D5A|nr:serine hydrolase domain-containing protein [Phenylobacterium parvum]